MDLINVFIDIFWATATKCVELIVPVVGLIILFKTLRMILFDRSF